MSTSTDTQPEDPTVPDKDGKGGCPAMPSSASLEQRLTTVLVAAEGDDLIKVVETIIKQRDNARDLLDWAESLLCNALPMSHCTQDEWDGALKKWRDLKHGAPSEPKQRGGGNVTAAVQRGHTLCFVGHVNPPLPARTIKVWHRCQRQSTPIPNRLPSWYLLPALTCSQLPELPTNTENTNDMGREIRKVPANWAHPKQEKPNYRTGQMEESYCPLYNRPYIQSLTEWIKDHEAWERGEHEGLTKYGHTKEEFPHYANYGGNAPDVKYYRPDWKPEEMTWWQVYETVSEGTPVTPPFETREELVEYLVENGDFWDQRHREEGRSLMPCEPWSRSNAEAFVMGTGWAPSMVIDGGKVMSGVEALSQENVKAVATEGAAMHSDEAEKLSTQE